MVSPPDTVTSCTPGEWSWCLVHCEHLVVLGKVLPNLDHWNFQKFQTEAKWTNAVCLKCHWQMGLSGKVHNFPIVKLQVYLWNVSETSILIWTHSLDHVCLLWNSRSVMLSRRKCNEVPADQGIVYVARLFRKLWIVEKQRHVTPQRARGAQSDAVLWT